MTIIDEKMEKVPEYGASPPLMVRTKDLRYYGESQQINKNSRACRVLAVFDKTKTDGRPNSSSLLSLDNFSMRKDTSSGNSRWVIFDKSSESEVTSGTWIVSSDMKIIGGPGVTLNDLSKQTISHSSGLTSSNENAGNVKGWLDTNINQDYIDDPPLTAQEFQPDFNSTFEMISYEDDHNESAVESLNDDSVDVGRLPTSYTYQKTKNQDPQTSPKGVTNTEPFEISKMVEEFSKILNQPKKLSLPRYISPKRSVSKKTDETRTRNISGYQQVDLIDSGLGESLAICHSEKNRQNIGEDALHLMVRSFEESDNSSPFVKQEASKNKLSPCNMFGKLELTQFSCLQND